MPDVWLTADDDLSMLSADEFEELARYHERERWVWEQVNQTQSEDYSEIVKHHRDRVRNFKELAAEEEAAQTAYEEERARGSTT